jgi:miniconductance mechanosensitive channel
MNFDFLPDPLPHLLAAHPWAQLLAGLVALALIALFLQWVVARIVLYVAHRLLVLAGHQKWDAAFIKHRAYHRLWYAVPFATIALGIDDVPRIGHWATVIGRVAHAGAWVCIFFAAGSALSAWQDVYAESKEAQTRSIKGYIQIGKLGLALVCGVLVLSILIDRSSRARSSHRTTCCGSATGSKCRKPPPMAS